MLLGILALSLFRNTFAGKRVTQLGKRMINAGQDF